MPGTSAQAGSLPAQDPAYRPTHPLELRDGPDVVIDY